jgi:O-antigen ligase
MRNLSLAVICIALGWSIPFVYPYAGEPLSSFYNDALAMGFGLAACVFLLLSPGPLLFPRALVAPVGLVLLIILQILLGWLPYPQWGLLAANFLLWASVMMMAGARLEAEWGLEIFAAPLAWALVAGGFANAMVSVAQAAGVGLPFWLAIPSMGHSVYGNLAQTNHLADYTSLATASAVYLFVTRRIAPVMWALLMIPLILTLAATGSRSVWLHMGALTVLAWWMGRRIAAPECKRLLFTCGLLLPALAGAAGLLALLRAVVPGAAVTTLSRMSAQTFAADPRLDLWREALQTLLANPLLGAGQGNFAYQHFLLNGMNGHPSYADTFENAHNLLLQIGAEFGLAGLALIAVAATLWLGRRWQAPTSVARWWCSAILAVIAVHSMLEYPLWYGHFLGVAAVAVGALDSAPWRLDSPAVRVRIWAGAMVAIGAFILASHIVDYRRLEAFLRDRVRLTSAGQTRAAVEGLLRLRNRSMLAPLVDFGLVRTIRYDPALQAANRELNGRVMRLFPVWDVVYRQAILLAMDGEVGPAAALWTQAVRGFPQKRDEFSALLARMSADGVQGTGALKEAVNSRMEKGQ